jgi:Flp pilus assembly protein TadD
MTRVLCALWLGACASPVLAAEPVVSQGESESPGANADVSAIAKDLPGTLEGEIRRAQLLRSKGDLDDAGHALAQLMFVAPDDARVVGEYGKVLAQQGHASDAIPFLKRATQMQPKDWTLYSALGVVYDQADDHAHARAAYERALELSPNEPAVLNNLAVSHMLTGDLPGAQRLLAQAVAAGANNPKIANNVVVLADMKGPGGQSAQRVASAERHEAVAPTNHFSPAGDLQQNGEGAGTGAPPFREIAVANKDAKPIATSRVAVAPPKPIASDVIMQAVPADPLAGPIKHKSSPRLRLASAAKPKHVVHDSAPPALRTAAEAN